MRRGSPLSFTFPPIHPTLEHQLTTTEPSLVVAKLPHRRQQRLLDLRVLHLVLPVQAQRDRLRVGTAVLQL